jgi:hypothetical protein
LPTDIEEFRSHESNLVLSNPTKHHIDGDWVRDRIGVVGRTLKVVPGFLSTKIHFNHPPYKDNSHMKQAPTRFLVKSAPSCLGQFEAGILTTFVNEALCADLCSSFPLKDGDETSSGFS